MLALVSTRTALELIVCALVLFAVIAFAAWREITRPPTKAELLAEQRSQEPRKPTQHLTWDELDNIDWREFSQARERWEIRYRMEEEFAERMRESKGASVHYLPDSREFKWEIDDKDAA